MNGRIYITAPEDKLGDLIRMLDRQNSPEACAMVLGLDLVHVPEEIPETDPLDRVYGVSY